MGRDNKPWWRSGKRCWYVKIGGRQKRLHADKGEALRLWHAMLGAPGEGTQSPIRTVSSVVEEYLAHVERTQRPASLLCKKKTLGRLCDDKGRMEARALNATGVVEWIASHRSWGQSRRWLAGIIVSSCWRWAGMPLGKLGLSSPMSRGKDAVMGEDAHKKLLEGSPPCYRLALRFLHGTGCRPSEMCAMEARHVVGGVAVLPDHKTSKRGVPRFIVLEGDALAVVTELTAAHPIGPLFRDTKDKRLTPERLRHWMRKRRIALGIKGAIPYGYRHAYATEALVRGVPDALVAALMGHINTAMIHKHYSHLTGRMEALREAARRARPHENTPPGGGPSVPKEDNTNDR